jgi:glycosyltransferase involved in cell wall biosynthesis
MKPLFSIIIPVYKVEGYLHKCVDSVLNQNFQDIEIILVNDGSPDHCPAICDEYALLDNRVKVIHKKNGGLSDARNQGIVAAKGDYILFLDSDDYWEGNNALDNLVKTINQNQADITLYGTKDINIVQNTTIISRGFYDIPAIQKNKDTAIKSLFETGHFPGSAWLLAIKRSFVIENELFFVTGIKAEDIDWLIHVFVKAQTFDAVNDAFYMYIKNRPGSITNTSDAKSAKDILFSVSKWRPLLENNLTPSNNYLLSYLAYHYIISYMIFSSVSNSDKKLLLPLMKNEQSILKYTIGKRGLACKLLIKFIGMERSGIVFRYGYLMTNKYPVFKRITT